MSGTKAGTGTLMTNAPTVRKSWSAGVGETETHQWDWEKDDLSTKYETVKGEAEAGGNIQSIDFDARKGRGTLVVKYGRQGNTNEGFGSDVTIIEELYAVDVMKHIAESPYFSTDSSDDDDSIAWVIYTVEQKLNENEITSEALRLNKSSSMEWSNWSSTMKELRYHMLHGAETYYETAFSFRQSKRGVRTSVIEATFQGVNQVLTPAGTAPTALTDISTLLGAFPTGEWLYRTPSLEYLSKGKWRVDQEWQWAEKWSKVYGGTWGL
jgi:hypothetical protein